MPRLISDPVIQVASYVRDRMQPYMLRAAGRDNRWDALRTQWDRLAAQATIDDLVETVKAAAYTKNRDYPSVGDKYIPAAELLTESKSQASPASYPNKASRKQYDGSFDAALLDRLERQDSWQESYFAYLMAVCDALNVPTPKAVVMFPNDEAMQKIYRDTEERYRHEHRASVIAWGERQDRLPDFETSSKWRNIPLTDSERHLLRRSNHLAYAQTLGELAAAMKYGDVIKTPPTLADVCRAIGCTVPDTFSLSHQEAEAATVLLKQREKEARSPKSHTEQRVTLGGIRVSER